MQLRPLPVLLVLLLLALPAAMLIYVSALPPEEVEPGPTQPRVSASGPIAPAPSRPEYRPEPSPTSARKSRLAARVTEGESEQAPLLDPRLAAQAMGRVVGPDGEPCEGVEVLALLSRFAIVKQFLHTTAPPDAFLLAGSARTDAAGRFRLERLDPQRRHVILARCAPLVAAVKDVPRLSVASPTQLGDLRLSVGVTVAGTCRDGSGEPVEGATVACDEAAWPDPRALNRALAPRAVTGEDGTYRLEGLPAGKLRLIAQASDRVPATRETKPIEPGRVLEGIDFVLEKGLELAGRVVDANGMGLAGVRVSGTPERDNDSRRSYTSQLTVTDDEGRFRFTGCPPGAWILNVTQRGTVIKPVRAVAGQANLRVVLSTSRVLKVHGVVVAHGTGAPIEGARVRLLSGLNGHSMMAGAGPGLDAAAVTGADGSFAFETMEQPGPSFVVARAEGYAPGEGAYLNLLRRSPEVPPLRIHMKRAASVSGRVVLAGGGTGTAVVYLFAMRPDDRRGFRAVVAGYGGPFPHLARVATDESGAFHIMGLDPGRYLLEAQAAGHAPGKIDDLRLEPGIERKGVVVSLGPGGSFTGRVRFRDGAPAIGFVVMLEGPAGRDRRLTVGQDGEFAFEYLSPGRYPVTLFAAPGEGRAGGWRHGERARAGAVTIVVGGRVIRNFTVDRNIRVHGTVRCAGLPVVGGRVRLVPQRPAQPVLDGTVVFGRALETRTDKEGRYELSGVPPGRARISVRVGHRWDRANALEHEVTVPRHAEWVLHLTVPTGGIRGRVFLPPGLSEKTGFPRLQLTTPDDPAVRRSVDVRSDGMFEFHHLAPGDYLLHVFADEHWGASQRRLEVGSAVLTGVEIRLVRGVPVSGVVVTVADKPVELATIWFRPTGRDDGRGRGFVEVRSGPHGRFKIPAIASGRYLVLAQKGGMQSTAFELVVSPGGRDDIHFVMKPISR